jgi:hypothetical protein
VGLIDKAKGVADGLTDKAKDVAGDAVVKAAHTAGPAMEKTKAVAGSVTFVVAGTVGELKDKLFGAQHPPAPTRDTDD